jgi:hypothetical protein
MTAISVLLLQAFKFYEQQKYYGFSLSHANHKLVRRALASLTLHFSI